MTIHWMPRAKERWLSGTQRRVAVSAGMLQRKVKKMVAKSKVRKVDMCWQERPHFPDSASPSSGHEVFTDTQLQPEYT